MSITLPFCLNKHSDHWMLQGLLQFKIKQNFSTTTSDTNHITLAITGKQFYH